MVELGGGNVKKEFGLQMRRMVAFAAHEETQPTASCGAPVLLDNRWHYRYLNY